MSLPTPLNPKNAAILAAASPEAIVDATTRLSPYLAQERWIGSQNAFAFDVVGTANARLNGAISSRTAKHFAEWVAASGPIHCLEGWSYLGRSFAALLSGDVDGARHLAYYAELRGAVSLLATCGISVLHNGHYAVYADGTIHQISKHGTHNAVWLYLNHWSQISSATRTVGQIVRPLGIALSDWLSHMPSGVSWRPVAGRWLRDLGMDIKTFYGDRAARNESSYRPMGLRRRNRPRIRDAFSIVDFVINTWRALEPAAAPFASVDVQFLRISLERAFARANRGQTATSNPAGFLTFVQAILAARSISDLQATELRRVLVGDTEPNATSTLRFAEGSSAPSDPACHFNVLSRAALMLRMATGASTRMLKSAGIEPPQYSFWWSRVGLNAGLWPVAPVSEDVTEYWIEIEESLELLEEWSEQSVGTQSTSFHGLVSTCGSRFHQVAAMELVGVIGVAA